MLKKYLIYIIGLFFYAEISFAQCDPSTPSFTANLTATPNGTWVSPSVPRNDTCCGWSGSDQCIKFTILLHPSSIGINFSIASGAVPPGALFYSINCGPPIAVGTPICLSGAGPHILTFCKPGNNNNSYQITAIPAPVIPDSILVRDGCTQTLSVSGFSVPTITWNSINPGPSGTYNSYLNCTTGCATVTVTPSGTPPPFVDYLVGGFAQSPCQASYYQDTVRVYFYSDLLATINPTLSTICFGSTNAVLTVTASGGLPPYTYSWVPIGNTTTVVTVGPGTYTVLVGDNTGCPPTTATAIVNQYTLPIVANAGPNFSICKNSPTVALNGTVTNASGGTWSGGTGTFSPVSNSVSTNYIPTAAELAAGFVQLYLTTTGNSGCPPDQDTVIVSFQNVPLANAGSNATVCANNNLVTLSGTVSGFSSTGQWSTSGSGVFTSTANLNTTYTPSASDISSGTINIILTSLANGVCPAATSTVVITITPSPNVNAGTGGSICNTNPFVLNGTIGGATTTGSWSTSGNGSFSPSINLLNASYNPGSADIAAGSVTLTLTSTGNGNCFSVSDTVIVSIKQLAIVNTGPNALVCSNTPTVALTGTVSGGTNTGIWSTNGTGAFTPFNTSLNNVYFLSAADIAAGIVNFTLSSTNNGPCAAVTSTMLVSVTQLPVVNAGANQLLCSSTTITPLNGSVTSNSNTGVWSTSGNGSFLPSANVINSAYTPGTADIASGLVTLSLTSTNNGACNAVTDTVTFKIVKLAVVNAGANQHICSNTTTVALSGTVTGGTASGTWGTNGSGAFVPGSAFLSNTYFVTVSDLALGTINYTLSSTNNGPCPVVTDTMLIFITPLAQVNAGPNQFVCSNTGSISLNGSVISNSNTGTWSSGGGGTYSPSNAVLNTNYLFTASDASNGSITFTLTSSNNAPCPLVKDTVLIKIRKPSIVNAGPDQTICSTSIVSNLNGSVSVGGGIWSTNGSGNVLPNASALNGVYNITSADINNGSVLFILTSTNNQVCPAVTDTSKLTIMKEISINLANDTIICAYQNPVQITAALSGGSGQYAWSSNGTGTFVSVNGFNTINYTMSAADIATGFVNLTVSSINNGPCGSKSASITVNINPAPTANFSASTYTANIPNDPIQFTNLSTGANAYYWSFGDGGFTSQTNPLYNYQTVGFYTVSLVAINEYNCRDTTDQVIKVITDIQFPNVFTPNANGSGGGSYNPADLSNDVFFPYTSGVVEYKLIIFNRWGELIFESHDLNIGWDGYFNGKLCQQDAYVWKANVTFFDGRVYNKTGNVTLLR